MKQPITKQLLEWLLENEYTFLVAENQSHLDVYEFTPVKWDVDAFLNSTFRYCYDEHVILSIHDALHTFIVEDYGIHDVILLGQPESH